jgi:hypothetical protein
MNLNRTKVLGKDMQVILTNKWKKEVAELLKYLDKMQME